LTLRIYPHWMAPVVCHQQLAQMENPQDFILR